MFEYKVRTNRAPQTFHPLDDAEVQRTFDEMARAGWRLVSAFVQEPRMDLATLWSTWERESRPEGAAGE